MLETGLSILAAAVLMALAVYLFTRQREWTTIPMVTMFVILATLEIVDDSASWFAFDEHAAMQLRLYLESFLPLSLLAFSYTYQKEVRRRNLTPAWYVLFAAAMVFPGLSLWFPLDEFIYAPDLSHEKMLFLSSMGYWFFLTITVACVVALVNIEAVFSLVRGTERWKAKFEVIGLSAIMTVLIAYYSQGLLYRTINIDLFIVRSAVLIIGAGLVFYSRLFRGSSGKVAVSRYFIYRSLSLFAVGLYLMALGLLGEGMKYLSGPVRSNLLVLLSICGGIVLLSVLLSEKLRRQVKVFIVKNFYKTKHDYRAAWLNLTDQLSSCRTMNDLQETVLAAYRNSFGLMGAALYLADRTRSVYRLAAQSSMPQCEPELVLSPDRIAYFLERERVLNPADGEHPLSKAEADHLRKTGVLLQVPLICGRQLEGIVMLGPQLIREELIYDDYDLMKIIARQAAASIVNYRLLEELADAREIAAVARISSFVIHDLKNMTAALSLMAENAEELIDNPEFQRDMVRTVRNSLGKMNQLSQRLRSVPEKNMLLARPVDLHRTCADMVKELGITRGTVDLSCSGAPVMVLADEDELRKAVTNLVQNALDACQGTGMVAVEVSSNGQNALFRVTDSGCGMDQDFIQARLFRPFRTSKEKGLGIGLYQTRQIIEAHRGRIEVESTPGKGSTFTIFLPLHEPGEGPGSLTGTSHSVQGEFHEEASGH